MKIKTLLIVVVTLFFSLNQANAQGYTFKVLANKGDNSIKKGKDWVPLKTGSTLNDSDEVKIGSSSYLGLMHSSGKTLELKSAGKYKVEDLATSVKAGNNSVASKYADFVKSKMSDNEEDINKNHRKYMAVTGAVERATSSAELKLIAPKTVDLLNTSTVLRWNGIENADGYQVKVSSMFDDVIMTKDVTETSTTLDLSEVFEKQKMIIVSIKSKGANEAKSDDYAIKKAANGNLSAVYIDLKNELSDEESSLNALIIASFFEDNNLLLDALTYYEKAIKLSPDVPDFKASYEQFIIRNGLGN
ncbi:MAG: hypothetical protein LAT68_04440 [Cyclobacteriaceae bacterium]|nr:hypothetical protein [Cyclobacteriaceae bacterium]MCH8515558.1 hypothetical protein [Cyclobacteriaceae bacterium]